VHSNRVESDSTEKISANITSADFLNERGICGTDQQDGAIKKGNTRQKVAPMLFDLIKKAGKRDLNPQ
jgi:hypothetical protein